MLLAMPGEVTGIAYEAESNRLATCNRNSVVQVFVIGPNMDDLRNIYSIVLSNHVPKAIAFGQSGSDIMTFGLYDGFM